MVTVTLGFEQSEMKCRGPCPSGVAQPIPVPQHAPYNHHLAVARLDAIPPPRLNILPTERNPGIFRYRELKHGQAMSRDCTRRLLRRVMGSLKPGVQRNSLAEQLSNLTARHFVHCARLFGLVSKPSDSPTPLYRCLLCQRTTPQGMAAGPTVIYSCICLTYIAEAAPNSMIHLQCSRLPSAFSIHPILPAPAYVYRMCAVCNEPISPLSWQMYVQYPNELSV